ncbi:MAG TPA: type II secretion system protein [Candidatus Saccharimonadales bacterium]|jgi:type II secretory pathway pseudopilin PulG|nr:type II secretion system protein [Candidatus Saccharimonadales bacterium]
MSLLEVLVVITIFAVLGVLVTQSIALTLQGSKKSESMVRARENLDYSLDIIERQIRNASSVYGDSGYIVPCPNSDTSIIYYEDQDGEQSSFSCQGTLGSGGSYIASGSAQLTSNTVKIMSCVFQCYPATGSNSPYVTIDLTVQDASSSGIQSANVSASTQIYLRNY